MTRTWSAPIGLAASFLLVAEMGFAQTAAGSIAGTVKDTTGAVLSGVTVEASSPALIEKVRTVATEARGKTRSSSCVPAAIVTFKLPGFTALRSGGRGCRDW